MKRFSFFLVILCALLLSVGLNSAMAQNGKVEIRAIKGLYQFDTLATGANIRFVLGLVNDIGTKCDVANGWQISSPDGAQWDSVTMDSCGPFSGGVSALAARFPVSYSYLNFYGSSPAGAADTVGILFSGTGNKPAQQLPVAYNDTAVAVQVWLNTGDLASNNGKHLCIDSSFYQPGGTWVWNYGTSTITSVYPTWTDVVAGAPAYVPGQGFCYVFYNIPNLPPKVTNTGVQCVWEPADFIDPSLSGSHCQAFAYDFDACDKEGDPYTFTLVSGPGTINASTGQWAGTMGSGLVLGTNTVVVRADDAAHGTKLGTMTVTVTNAAPVLSGCPSGTVGGFMNAPIQINLAATDADACDAAGLAWSATIAPVTGASVAFNPAVGPTSQLTFTATAAGSYVVTVTVTDQLGATATCNITFDISASSPFTAYIQKVDGESGKGVYQGTFVEDTVYAVLADNQYGIGGFDFLLAYDNSALSLQGVTPGTLISSCQWEYFTYRFGAEGNCSGGCPSGLVRVVGIAETNNGAHHPVAGCSAAGKSFFVLKFLVTNNRTYACQYVPVRFFWLDCGDNTISSEDGSVLMIEQAVYDYAGSVGNPYILMDSMGNNSTGFPGYLGPLANDCPGDPNKGIIKRDILFYNGGIDIICAESIDARGDINLNGVANEVADAVMFTNYFIKGLTAFGTNPQHQQGSIAASDVNADGIALSVADLVYLIRVIIGDALPYPKTSPVMANFKNDNGTISVDQPMGAAFITVAGNVTPIQLAKNMKMDYQFDGVNTRILVYPPISGAKTESFTGNFITVNGTILNIEMATADGAPVVGKLVPANYALRQNYPNPFNPTTTISFDLPVASDYTLTIYNVTGQVVAEFTKTAAQAGQQDILWNATNNASGVYFYKLVAGNYTDTKKMVLLK